MRGILSNIHQSDKKDLIEKFTDTSLYLDDIFTIHTLQFEKYISDTYTTEMQLNKANTSDKETSFLDLNIKVICSDIHTSVYDKRDDFRFPVVNFPWFSGHAGHTRKASRISKAAVDNCGKGVGNFYLS